MVDVAVVAQTMWCSVLSPAAHDRLTESLGLSVATAEHWVAFLAGLHDLGKVCPVF
jgi:CRISPR-associated endonuclease/helicase Cas3